MPEAIPSFLRKEIVRLCEGGKSVTQVSEILGLGYAGVCKIWREYRQKGESALELGYSRCGRRPQYDQTIKDTIKAAQLANEDLGAPIIRSRLLASGALSCVPHERTMQRWWQSEGSQKSKGRRPKINPTYAQSPHHTWQVDGKEKVQLGSEEKVCYLSCTDEATCSFLQGYVFPLCSSHESG